MSQELRQRAQWGSEKGDGFGVLGGGRAGGG